MLLCIFSHSSIHKPFVVVRLAFTISKIVSRPCLRLVLIVIYSKSLAAIHKINSLLSLAFGNMIQLSQPGDSRQVNYFARHEACWNQRLHLHPLCLLARARGLAPQCPKLILPDASNMRHIRGYEGAQRRTSNALILAVLVSSTSTSSSVISSCLGSSVALRFPVDETTTTPLA